MKYLKSLVFVAMVIGLMAFLEAGTASATVACESNANTNTCQQSYPAGTAFDIEQTGSAKFESSGTVIEECAGSTLKGKTENVGSASETLEILIESLTWNSCTTTFTTLSTGSLEVHWIAGTDNGTLTVQGFEWTRNTVFGSCTYGFGASPRDLGTITSGSPATISINVSLLRLSGPCPEATQWTSSYKFVEPDPLYFSSESAPEPPKPSGVLCKTNTSTLACPEIYSTGQALEASLKEKTSAVLELTGGTVLDECTSSTLKGKTTNTGSSSEAVKASIESLSWSGCTKTTDTLKSGSLEFAWIAGTDNATLTGKETEWTVNTIFGTCTYGFGTGTDLGTITGGSPATIGVNVVLKEIKGLCPEEARWTAEYTFTAPTPLYFTFS